MKAIFQNMGNEGGIYKIINLQNGRIYIGSTYRFKERFRGHNNDLVMGRHLNKFLQNDWNKCGSDVFVFEAIKSIENKAERLAEEQVFIDQHYDGQKQCYNLRDLACDSRAGKKQRLPSDPFTDKRCQTSAQEILGKRVIGLKKVYEDNPELREVSRKNALKRWEGHSSGIVIVNQKTGEEVKITGSVREFCTSRNLNYKAFHLLTKGKTKSSGGWYLKSSGPPVYTSQKGQIRKPLSSEHKAKISKRLLGNQNAAIILQ